MKQENSNTAELLALSDIDQIALEVARRFTQDTEPQHDGLGTLPAFIVDDGLRPFIGLVFHGCFLVVTPPQYTAIPVAAIGVDGGRKAA